MSAPIFCAYAPGRVELLGNHTDYNAGVVLGAAIERGLTVRGSGREDEWITLESATKGAVKIKARELRPRAEEGWANYVLGVVSELRELGLSIPAFEAEIAGDLPAGAGLSSSAALEVATALFLLKLSGQTLSPLDVAKACQRAEHHFVGVQSGLLDQVTSLFGRKDQAVFFDCRSEEVRTVSFPSDLALIVADTGKRRALASGVYNQRREETHAAARALGVAALRDVSLRELESRTDLPGLLQRRARHIVGENERVFRALDFLANGNGQGFGQLLNESHESSRTNFENSTPELDRLIGIAQSLSGVLGARLTGAGFGGAAIILCERVRASEIARQVATRYRDQTGLSSTTMITRPADGAR